MRRNEVPFRGEEMSRGGDGGGGPIGPRGSAECAGRERRHRPGAGRRGLRDCFRNPECGPEVPHRPRQPRRFQRESRPAVARVMTWPVHPAGRPSPPRRPCRSCSGRSAGRTSGCRQQDYGGGVLGALLGLPQSMTNDGRKSCRGASVCGARHIRAAVVTPPAQEPQASGAATGGTGRQVGPAMPPAMTATASTPPSEGCGQGADQGELAPAWVYDAVTPASGWQRARPKRPAGRDGLRGCVGDLPDPQRRFPRRWACRSASRGPRVRHGGGWR